MDMKQGRQHWFILITLNVKIHFLAYLIVGLRGRAIFILLVLEYSESLFFVGIVEI